MTETVPACPECASSSVHSTNAKPRGEASAAHYCNECSATFDEATERERGGNGGVIHGAHARALIEASPDVVPDTRGGPTGGGD